MWEAGDDIAWKSEKNHKMIFIEKNFETLKTGILKILNSQSEYFISKDGLNPFIYEGLEFEKYYNNCGEAKDWIYPVMDIVISHGNKNGFSQNHYEFLRTDNGYKLISVTIRN